VVSRFHHYYDYIDFFPGVPDAAAFTLPTNPTGAHQCETASAASAAGARNVTAGVVDTSPQTVLWGWTAGVDTACAHVKCSAQMTTCEALSSCKAALGCSQHCAPLTVMCAAHCAANITRDAAAAGEDAEAACAAYDGGNGCRHQAAEHAEHGGGGGGGNLGVGGHGQQQSGNLGVGGHGQQQTVAPTQHRLGMGGHGQQPPTAGAGTDGDHDNDADAEEEEHGHWHDDATLNGGATQGAIGCLETTCVAHQQLGWPVGVSAPCADSKCEGVLAACAATGCKRALACVKKNCAEGWTQACSAQCVAATRHHVDSDAADEAEQFGAVISCLKAQNCIAADMTAYLAFQSGGAEAICGAESEWLASATAAPQEEKGEKDDDKGDRGGGTSGGVVFLLFLVGCAVGVGGAKFAERRRAMRPSQSVAMPAPTRSSRPPLTKLGHTAVSNPAKDPSRQPPARDVELALAMSQEAAI
jgi:hypothetical protein